MNTVSLKRTCELLLSSSQDLVNEENTTGSLKRVRLYAMQIIDLMEEKCESFVEMLFKLSLDEASSLNDVIRWINTLVRTTWYNGNNYVIIRVSCRKTYTQKIIPVLHHLGFWSGVPNKELIVRIMPLPNAKMDTVAYKYIKHQYGDYELVRIRRNMYQAFFDRKIDPYLTFYREDVPNVKSMTKEEQQVYLIRLKDILLKELGLVLNINTFECTPHDTHAKMLMDHLL